MNRFLQASAAFLLSACLLFAVLAPLASSLRAGSERRKAQLCVTNLQALGRCLMLYSMDYDQRTPMARDWPSALSLYVRVAYTRNYRPEFLCPKARERAEFDGFATTYAYNRTVAGIRPWQGVTDVTLVEAEGKGLVLIGHNTLPQDLRTSRGRGRVTDQPTLQALRRTDRHSQAAGGAPFYAVTMMGNVSRRCWVDSEGYLRW